jgi:hypothetical protein
MGTSPKGLRRTAVSATLHCLTGCAIGEVLGLIIGTALGWSNFATLVLAIALAFLFGYALSLRPLLRAGLAFAAAVPIVLAADSLSIFVMEVIDNLIVFVVPGAMDARLASPLFWGTLAVALLAAFVAALPVNYFLLAHGQGHALTHQYHHDHEAHANHEEHPHEHH